VAFSCSEHDRVAMGDCGGIAERLGVPSITVRLTFLLLTLASGVGLVLYLLLALLMLPPGFDEGSVVARLRVNSRRLGDGLGRAYRLGVEGVVALTAQREREPALVRAWVGGGLLLLGVLILSWSLGLLFWLTFWRTVGIGLILIGLGFLRGLSRRSGALSSEPQEESPAKGRPLP